MQARVSVIVPTRDRPQLVGRAVRSALAQTIADIEVRVVLDGPDERTVAVLEGLSDDRVRVDTLPKALGHAHALNVGVAGSRAPWIAFLDDDEWLPDKLVHQLRTAEDSRHAEPIVSCRFIARSDRDDLVWPRRTPAAGQPLSEYLFCRRSPFFGDGVLLHSTLLAPSALVRRVPFDPALPRHADLDWLLRASREPGFGIEFVRALEPLAIWHADGAYARISAQPDWRFSRRWIEERRALVTPRAHASFLLTWVAANAVRQGERRALPEIARDAFRAGEPDARAVVVFLAILAFPHRLRDRLSRWATRSSRPVRFRSRSPQSVARASNRSGREHPALRRAQGRLN